MTDFISEIKERRVLPAVGVYAAGCWVVVEILDRLVARYLLSPYLTDAVFWGLYSLIPAVVLMAWSYGRPGKDKATTAQKIGVPINVIATVGLLITLFSGEDFGAAANRVTVDNEQGERETHIVPAESFRRRMAVFFFKNESGDPGLDWLQYAATELLVQDLQQDPFVIATSPWSNWGNGYYARMKQAGFEHGIDMPRSLMRQIAQEANRQYFVEGSITREADELRLTTRVWDSTSVELLTEISRTGWDMYSMLDEVSREVRKQVGVPDAGLRQNEDLPLAETYGESELALKLYIEALNQRLFNNDLETATEKLDEALQADPDFVLAHFTKAINAMNNGNLPEAQSALQATQRLDYRLPAVDRAKLKAINYRLSGQTDKSIEFLRLQTRLRGDADSHTDLGNMLMVTGALEEAKQEFKTALQKDSLNVGANLVLSVLERATGNMESAVSYAQQYQRERPEDIEAHIQLGDLLRDSGQLDVARQHYEQAQLLENNPVHPTLRLAIIAARKGDEQAARNLLEQAEDLAQTPTDKAAVRQSASYLEMRFGRVAAAIEQVAASEEFLSQSQPPFGVALAVYGPLVQLNLHRDDYAAAETALQAAKQMLQPPMDKFLSFNEAQIHIKQNKLDEAEAAMARAVDIIDQFDFDPLRFQVSLLQADIAEVREDPAMRAEFLQLGLQQIDRSFIAAELYAQLVPGLYAELAHAQVLAGDLEGAEHALNAGFSLDPSEPMLWVAKARFQLASGMQQLAAASISYALAIWENADPEFDRLQQALALEKEIAG